jgi:hypothetical protein
MAEDFMIQQQMRPSKQKACLHAILSFYPGENPSDETLKEITLKYLSGLGVVNTQFAVIKHTDKAHLHLHIVANMVNNDGKAIADSWIGLRGKKLAQQLTEEYQLIPALKKNLDLTHLEALNQSEADKYTIYQAIAENLPLCRTMEELEKSLLKRGIETQYKYKGQTAEKQGISFKLGDYCFKGSQVDRKFSLAGLQKTLEQQLTHDLEPEQQRQNGPKQKQGFPDQSASRRSIVPRQAAPSPPLPAGDTGKNIGADLAHAMQDIIEALLKPEETGGQVSQDFLQEERWRKKKKRRRL